MRIQRRLNLWRFINLFTYLLTYYLPFYIQAYGISPHNEVEGTHRVRTHAVLLLTLAITFTFKPQNHVTYRISQDHSLCQV